jgi:hypothetical protein
VPDSDFKLPCERLRYAAEPSTSLAVPKNQLLTPQVAQGFIGHCTHSTKRMALGDTLFRAYVTEHIQLLFIVSTHGFFLSALLVEANNYWMPRA